MRCRVAIFRQTGGKRCRVDWPITTGKGRFPMMEFHIARKARERYQFAESLFSYTGNVVFANLAACREFALPHQQGARRGKASGAGGSCRPALRHGADRRGQPCADGALPRALRSRGDDRRSGLVFRAWWAPSRWSKMLLTFVEQFPGISVMRGQLRRRSSGSPERRMEPRTGPSRWKNCCCCGPPTAMRLFSLSRSFLKKRRWPRRRFIAR